MTLTTLKEISMTKKIIALSLLLVPSFVASVVLADSNVGGCGWGSKLMDGQQGIAPQVLAVTTNGTSGNQTFGISSGTSGCTQDGVVRSNWKTAMFIDSNMNKLARDIAVGHGEALDSLASLLSMNAQDKEVFFSIAQNNFGLIFPNSQVSSQEVRASLKSILETNGQLKGYAPLV